MKFKHNFLQYEELTQDMSSGERHYILPDGSVVPSVTTVLSRLNKDALDAWKKRVGPEEAARVSSQATVRGTAIHSICEQYLSNNPNYRDKIMPVNLETFKRLQPYLDENIGTIYGLEVPLYSKILNCAGRTDCIAEYKNRLSIIDFKTSLRPKKEEWIKNYFIQATCYAMMAEALFGLDIPQIVIMIAIDHEDPQIFRRKKEKFVPLVQEIFK